MTEIDQADINNIRVCSSSLNENQKRHIRQWIAALRSGDYTQGMHTLLRIYSEGEKAYCCLGVAADVYRKTTHKLPIRKIKCYDRLSQLHGTKFINYFGLSRDAEIVLMRLNDRLHLDFNEIADILEKHLLGETDENQV